MMQRLFRTAILFGAAALAILIAAAYAEDANSAEAPALSPITTEPWLMATASVSDIDRTARFFTEIDGLDGRDFEDRCKAPNLGWLSVTYPVADADLAKAQIETRGWEIETEPCQTKRGGAGS